MPSRITCFWLEPTDQVEISYRRFVFSSTADKDAHCSAVRVPFPGALPAPWGYHDVSAMIERRTRAKGDAAGPPAEGDLGDERWPKTCACGYVFKPTDQWMKYADALYRRSDTLDLVTIRAAPAGAMWDAHWFRPYHQGPDGLSIVLKTPAGDWHIDGPSSNGPGWNRTGRPPKLTVSPSIGMGEPQRMHGVLTDGVLAIDRP